MTLGKKSLCTIKVLGSVRGNEGASNGIGRVHTRKAGEASMSLVDKGRLFTCHDLRPISVDLRLQRTTFASVRTDDW